MAGYEDLTSDQLIYIVQLVSIVIIVFSFSQLIRSLITLKISKNIKHLELMIEKKYDEGIKKPSFFETVKNWWVKRKEKKKKEGIY